MVIYNIDTDNSSSATEDAAPVPVKKSKNPKPTLEDESKPKPAKKEVPSDKSTDNTNGNAPKAVKSAAKELKLAKASKSKAPKVIDNPIDAEDDNEEVEGENDESEIDDQTEALLKGFESDGDDEDAEKEGGLEDGDEIPKVPTISNRSKKQLQSAAIYKKDDKPGVVYVGRIPHGFYEHEMKEYFKQFGPILKIRLSRNKKTGASRHIAWIQFESSTVAEIVAKTMDNYLLFNHILKVKVVPDEQLSANIWKGANKRFKKIPWNRMEARKLAEAQPEHVWEKRNEREQRKRDKKAEKMKAIGYEFEVPKLKSAEGVAKKAEQPALLTDTEEVKAIETAPAPATEAEGLGKKEKNRKREKKAQAIEASKAAADVTKDLVAEERSTAKKEKKDKKRKATDVEDTPAISTIVALAESAEKGLKTKNSKTNLAEAADEASEDKVKKPRKSKKVKSIT